MRELSSWQEAAERAHRASGARLVWIGRIDSQRGAVDTVALAGLGLSRLSRAMDAIRFVVPRFDPRRSSFPIDLNPALQPAYRGGAPTALTMIEAATGSVDPRVISIACRMAGLNHVFLVPVMMAGRVEAAICFSGPDRLDADAQQVCRSIANAVAERLNASRAGNAFHLEEMGIVPQPLAKVFAFVSDPRRFTAWHVGVEEVRSEPPGPSRPGTVITEVRRILGHAIESTYEVVALEENRFFTVRSRSGPFSFTAEVRFAPAGRGTLVTVIADIEVSPLLGLAAPLMERAVRRQVEAGFAELNDLMLSER